MVITEMCTTPINITMKLYDFNHRQVIRIKMYNNYNISSVDSALLSAKALHNA